MRRVLYSDDVLTVFLSIKVFTFLVEDGHSCYIFFCQCCLSGQVMDMTCSTVVYIYIVIIFVIIIIMKKIGMLYSQ